MVDGRVRVHLGWFVGLDAEFTNVQSFCKSLLLLEVLILISIILSYQRLRLPILGIIRRSLQLLGVFSRGNVQMKVESKRRH